jgi:hypothetical protein
MLGDYSLHRTSYSRTGSSNPRRATSPQSANRKPLPLTSPLTTLETSILPPGCLKEL